MAFNPLMARIVSRSVTLLGEHPTVLDLGVQTFREGDRAGLSVDGTTSYYRSLGFVEHESIDVNGQAGCLVMDLNESIRSVYGYTKTFSLVTNCGTSEHIFDQRAFMENVHDLADIGGLMVHAVPFLNYINHGFYNYHPGCFLDLAAANRYEVCTMGIADRTGRGVEMEGTSLSVLSSGRKISRHILTSRPWFPRAGFIGRIRDYRRRRELGYILGSAIADVIGARRNIQIFVVLRKTVDLPFKPPMQSMYIDDIVDPSIRAAYAQ